VSESPIAPEGYLETLEQLKQDIRQARTRAALAVNAEVVELYWRIGRAILDRQEHDGWGANTIGQLARDLSRDFPDMKGLSRSNLYSMRAFAAAWSSEDVHQLGGQLPWRHHVALLQKLQTREQRLFYLAKAAEHGWSRPVLEAQIASKLHEREGKALTNFDARLPKDAAKAAQMITRDPYNLEFLHLTEDAEERDIERALIADLRAFMLELGAGFAFVGSQVHIDVDGDDFYVDLLFFHIPTNRYIVMDLKIGKFVPRDAGQINFYVNVIDDKLRLDHHAPTIGLVLCASRNQSVVRYALDGLTKPVGVASWQLPDRDRPLAIEPPADVHLPSAAQLQAGLDRFVEAHADAVRAVEDAAAEDT
jgi:predicted nuclease of restriction endonuclease-like (RecB) superfamily